MWYARRGLCKGPITEDVEGLQQFNHVPRAVSPEAREAKEKEVHLLISQLRAIREKVELMESTPPPAMVDLKGKAPKNPSSKPQNKRMKTKPLLGSAKEGEAFGLLMSTTRMTKV